MNATSRNAKLLKEQEAQDAEERFASECWQAEQQALRQGETAREDAASQTDGGR